MKDLSPELARRLHRQRSEVLQGILWILLAVVVAAACVGTVLDGTVTIAALVPRLANVGLVGAALWLNDRRRTEAAVGLVVGAALLSASLPLLVHGLAGERMFLYFVPIVLAGLLLGRRALYLTAGTATATVLAAPILHDERLRLGDPIRSDAAWLVAVEFVLVLAAVTLFLDRFGVLFQATMRTALEREVAHREEVTERLKTREALVDEQRFTDAIVGHLPGLFYVLDEQGRYVRWNRNLVDAIGFDESELPNVSPLDLIDERDRDLVASRLAEAFENGHASAEAALVTRNGDRVPYFLNGTRVTLGGATYLAGIGIDRTEIDAARARIEALNAELEERLERITALHEIDKAITGSLDLELTLDVVLQQVTKRLGVDAAAILLYDPIDLTLRHGASRGFSGRALHRTVLRLGEGLAGRAGLQRERVVVDDPDAFDRAFADASSIQGEGFRSYAAVPLLAKGELQGILEIFHRSPLDASDDWTDYLVTLATQAAIALDGTRMFADLERANTELRLAYDTTIEGWARALDLKDEETEGHSRRVTTLTVHLAERMGINDEDLVHLRRGALLHDIGKMGVPDRILLKPDKLDPDEWDTMKRHTTYAHELLSPIAFLRPALDIPYCHHEKWDGSGYPRGLRGHQIPLPARLFAVVDVYDALTNDRPYRNAWTEDQALAHIRTQAGTHFDPAAVEAFFDLRKDARSASRR